MIIELAPDGVRRQRVGPCGDGQATYDSPTGPTSQSIRPRVPARQYARVLVAEDLGQQRLGHGDGEP